MKYKNVKVNCECPLCSSTDAKKLYKINSHDATRYLRSEDDPLFEEIKVIIEKLWGQKHCTKYMCDDCKLIYVKPFIGGNKEFYSKMYHSGDQYPNERLEYELTLDAIFEINKYELSLLEVGAGKGVFLSKVKSMMEVYGNEISEPGIAHLTLKGIKNYPDIYSEDIKRKFDIICSFAVIEHLDDLQNLFKRWTELLNDDGHLFMSTHETSKVLFFEGNNAGLDVAPTHISCWNKESFLKVCELYGYEYVEDKYINLSFMRKMINFGLGMFELRKIKDGSTEDMINNIKSKKVRKLFIYGYLFTLSPYIFYKTVGRKIVSRQWVHLKKK